MPTALIIGASRGIGRELARQYKADGWRVIATARRKEDCDQLTALGAQAHTLDVTSADSIAALAWKLDDERIDAAWLAAGIYGPQSGIPTQEEFDMVMHTNVLSAMRLIPVVAPLVGSTRGKLAVLSSRMGTLGARASDDATVYRASKAALNSVLLDAAIVYGPHGATCVSFHPGWVKTEMGGPDAPLSPEQSARNLRTTLAGLTEKANGTFLNHDGSPIPW